MALEPCRQCLILPQDLEISEQCQGTEQNSSDTQGHFLAGRNCVRFFCPILGRYGLSKSSLYWATGIKILSV